MIVCSRYEDIASHRRTVMHFIPWTASEKDPAIAVGDELCIAGHKNSPRGAATVVTEASEVSMLDAIEADLQFLGCDRATYEANWDRLHPEAPMSSNPMVVRIRFRYGFSGDSE